MSSFASNAKSIALVAGLAAIASVIYLLVNHVIYLLTITHDVQIEISYGDQILANHTQDAVFKVINNGRIPVTGLSLKMMTPFQINSFRNDSTVHVSWIENKSTSIEAYAPKLVHGSGSFVLISVVLNPNKPTNYDKYSAYAIYDQGSKKADLSTVPDVEQVLSTNKPFSVGFLAIGVVILCAVLVLTLTKFFDYLKNFHIRTKRKIE